MISVVRHLLRSPWFTVTAVVVLALGIGVSAATFGVMNAVLFRPLPYHDPDRLVWIATWHPERGQYSKSSGWDFDAWRQRSSVFEAVEASWDRPMTLTGTEHPEAVVGWQFTAGLFAMLGTNAALGRTFVAEDGEPGRDNVVVLSDALWKRRFAADPAIVGRRVELDGRSHTIIGVMPPEFAHPYPIVQLWTPLPMPHPLLHDRKQRPFRVAARLREGITRERAEAELRTLADQQAREFPDTHVGWTVRVRPLREFYVGDAGQLLWVLQGAAALLLVVAASNVAGLLLVRATVQQRDTAIRLALGASRMQLFRDRLIEGFTLTAAAAVLGLLFATWGIPVLAALLSTRLNTVSLPQDTAGWIDARVLIAVAIATVVVAAAFGLTPLLRRPGALADALQAAGRGATADRRTRALRGAIVIGQLALAVALLTAAGLLVRSIGRLQARTFGFDTTGVVTAQLQLPRDRYPNGAQTAAFLNQLVERVNALPGVHAAAAINTLPLTGFNALRPYGLPGSPPEERFAEFRIVTPDYFRVMSIPLRRGRTFDERDRTGSPDVVIVNETAARHLWPGADPIGRRLETSDFGTPSPRTVVGVVGDTRHHDLARDPEAELYRPAYQAYWPFFGLVVRTTLPAESLERPLRDAAAEVDRNVPLAAIRPLGDLADATLSWRRASMVLLLVFAGAALGLALIGVYGVMAYAVAQRSREMGVRLALGARPGDIARLIFADGARLAGVGVALGLLIAAAFAGLLGALVFGIPTRDSLTFAAVAIVTAVSALSATAIPALRAARVDPVVAIRE